MPHSVIRGQYYRPIPRNYVRKWRECFNIPTNTLLINFEEISLNLSIKYHVVSMFLHKEFMLTAKILGMTQLQKTISRFLLILWIFISAHHYHHHHWTPAVEEVFDTFPPCPTVRHSIPQPVSNCQIQQNSLCDPLLGTANLAWCPTVKHSKPDIIAILLYYNNVQLMSVTVAYDTFLARGFASAVNVPNHSLPDG